MQIAAIAGNNEGLDGGPKITNGIKHDFQLQARIQDFWIGGSNSVRFLSFAY